MIRSGRALACRRPSLLVVAVACTAVGLSAACSSSESEEDGGGGSAGAGGAGGVAGAGGDAGSGGDAASGASAGTAGGPAGAAGSIPEPERLTVDQESAPWGRFDPSLESDSQGTVWMSYSGIFDDPPRVTTQLARSGDQGASWTHVAELNPAPEDTIEIEGTPSTGRWWQEVSTLVHDPGDPDPGRRWKIYWHEYFHDTERRFLQGWIASRHAPSPEGPWSDRRRLFGSSFTDAAFPTEVNVNDLDPALAMCVVYTEPGAVATGDDLYLALTCAALPEPITFSQVLLRSADHGESWDLVATIAGPQDASAFDAINFQAPDLVHTGDGDYLLLTPVRQGVGLDDQPGPAYQGCYAMRFADLAAGELERDGDGQLVAQRHVEGDPDRFRGACSFDGGNVAGGIVLSQFYPEEASPFQILATKQALP